MEGLLLGVRQKVEVIRQTIEKSREPTSSTSSYSMRIPISLSKNRNVFKLVAN